MSLFRRVHLHHLEVHFLLHLVVLEEELLVGRPSAVSTRPAAGLAALLGLWIVNRHGHHWTVLWTRVLGVALCLSLLREPPHGVLELRRKEHSAGPSVLVAVLEFCLRRLVRRSFLGERADRAALARSVGCIVSAYKPEYADAEFAVAMELLPGASAPRLVGLCLAVDVADFERQARRVHAFLSRGGTVRLVKGGWYSGSSYSTLAWREVTLRFVALAVVATRWGFGAQMWIATHDLAAAREIAARVDTPPRLSMFHTAYRAGRGATAGVFYGAVPFAQALRDVSWSNAALRFAALRSADLHVSDRMIRARIREVEALFLLHNASAAP